MTQSQLSPSPVSRSRPCVIPPILQALGMSLFVVARSLAAESDLSLSGGETTSHSVGKNAFSLPLANLSKEHRRAFTVGNAFFNQNWVQAPGTPDSRDGLGPFFHARSCSACHPLDGRGSLPAAASPSATSVDVGPDGPSTSGLLYRLGTPQAASIPHYGSQLAPRALPGLRPEAQVALSFETKEYRYPDGSVVLLKAPRHQASEWAYGPPPADLRLSARLAPQVFGLGLLEAIPIQSLQSLADPDDANADGISGRLAWLPAAPGAPAGQPSTQRLGRFGWKAAEPTLRSQTIAALGHDMGLTSDTAASGGPAPVLAEPSQAAAVAPYAHGAPAGQPEVSEKILQRLESYLRSLAPPARRRVGDAVTTHGSELFHQIGCAACHTMEWRTGAVAGFPELESQVIRPGTDLLLHDMGPDLADDRPEGAASGTEWRTPPLWGLGLLRTVHGQEALLHDGRASSFEEAILWHGGEAEKSRLAFALLSSEDRQHLTEFLKSL